VSPFLSFATLLLTCADLSCIKLDIQMPVECMQARGCKFAMLGIDLLKKLQKCVSSFQVHQRLLSPSYLCRSTRPLVPSCRSSLTWCIGSVPSRVLCTRTTGVPQTKQHSVVCAIRDLSPLSSPSMRSQPPSLWNKNWHFCWKERNTNKFLGCFSFLILGKHPSR